jgi:integrase
MPLSDTAIRAAKPRAELYRMADFDGLVLHVTPNGGKWWRLRYYFAGKAKMLSLGTYPEVGLKEARTRRDEARKLVAAGVDPSAHRKQTRIEHRLALGNTFQAVASEWFEFKSPTWAASTREKIRFYLDSDLIPLLGERLITDLRRPDLVNVLRVFERRKAFNVAKKARGWLGQIFKFATSKGLIENNPATGLEVVAAAAPPTKAHASLPLHRLPSFLQALSGYQGSPLTLASIQLLLLTGVRPGELRKAQWSEFDLTAATWSIPAERMKMRRAHIVPLPTQAVQILERLRQITSYSELVFPSRDDRRKPMSENTVNVAFSRLGFKGQQTGHGFRHLISTALNERGFNRDWIERQLAHGDDNEIRQIYNQAQYLDQRRQMMQTWADYISTLTE